MFTERAEREVALLALGAAAQARLWRLKPKRRLAVERLLERAPKAFPDWPPPTPLRGR